MQHGNLTLIAPALSSHGHSEAEIFGSIAWLAMQSKNKKQMEINSLSQWLLPALKNHQFVLATQSLESQQQPIAYMSWANLTAEVESRYVKNPDKGFGADEWTGGDRMWVIDWMTPFGHSHSFSRAIVALLANSCLRSLYHRGGDRGLRIQLFRGEKVSIEQAQHWWRDKPILAQRN